MYPYFGDEIGYIYRFDKNIAKNLYLLKPIVYDGETYQAPIEYKMGVILLPDKYKGLMLEIEPIEDKFVTYHIGTKPFLQLYQAKPLFVPKKDEYKLHKVPWLVIRGLKKLKAFK